jgi:invasion protein IalB
MRAFLAVATLVILPAIGAAQMPSAALLDSAPLLPDIRSHADWRVACTAEGCTAEPAVQVPPLTLALTRDSTGDVLILRAPLGLLLGEGVAVTVDGRALGRLAFLTCEPDGCVAPVRLGGALRGALRGGRELTLTLIRRDGTAITASYSLIGFIAATTDLSASLSGIDAAP